MPKKATVAVTWRPRSPTTAHVFSAARALLFAGLSAFPLQGCGSTEPGAEAGELADAGDPADARTDGRSQSQPPPADAGAPWQSLIEHASWREAPLGADPLADHQPDPVECGLAGWLLERGMLEIDTGRCNYLWIHQPAQRAVQAGDQLSMRVLHFDLTAPEPARAHLAVLFGDDVVAEREVDIPHVAQALDLEWTAERDLAPGERVGLHLHNHGQNTWLVTDIQVQNKL